MFNPEHIKNSQMEIKDMYKELANKTVRVVYVDVEGYVMAGLYDPEHQRTYVAYSETS